MVGVEKCDFWGGLEVSGVVLGVVLGVGCLFDVCFFWGGGLIWLMDACGVYSDNVFFGGGRGSVG